LGHYDTQPMSSIWRAAAFAFALFAALASCGGVMHGVPVAMTSWNRPFAPFRVAGNIYYVGTSSMALFLVTTRAGHILIDSGFEDNVPRLQKSVEALGFRFQDIKILLSSHAHIDHVQGHALVKQLTGARVMASAEDALVIRTGGQHEWMYGDAFSWPPCPVDAIVKDGDKVELGGTTFVAHLTPGHTRGATTWTTTVDDEGRRLSVVFFSGANIPPSTRITGNADYPRAAADFEHSFATWKALPVDVFLAAHGEFFDLASKRKRQQTGERPNPFIDPAGYRRTITEAEQAFRDVVASER
jgi:metallo-beta-lactamase class B